MKKTKAQKEMQQMQDKLQKEYEALSLIQKINYCLTEIKKNNDTVSTFIEANKLLTQELTNLTITETNE